jgi:hypothetical protein
MDLDDRHRRTLAVAGRILELAEGLVDLARRSQPLEQVR